MLEIVRETPTGRRIEPPWWLFDLKGRTSRNLRRDTRGYAGISPMGMARAPAQSGPGAWFSKLAPYASNAMIGNPSAPASVGAAGGFQPEVQTITSATTMAPTTNGETLIGMVLYPGAKPAWLELTVLSPNKLIFPARIAGLDATGAIGPGQSTVYPMDWFIPGTTGVASGSMTFGGSLQAVDFIYAKKPNPTRGIDLNRTEFLGEAAETDESGTSGTNSTVTFTAGISKPRSIAAVSTIEATATGIARARVQFPKQGSYAVYSVPAESPLAAHPRLWHAPDYDPSTTIVLVHKADTLGGATNVGIAHFLYYDPAPLAGPARSS